MSAGGERPIHGAWQNDNEWVSHSWAAEGWHHSPEAPCSLDLNWPIKA